jgi:hypothetical protein
MPQGISRRTERARQERAPGHPEPDALRHGWHRQLQKHRRCPLGIGCWRERPAMGETKALGEALPRAFDERTARCAGPDRPGRTIRSPYHRAMDGIESHKNTTLPHCHRLRDRTPGLGCIDCPRPCRAERSSAASFPKPVSRTRGWSLTDVRGQRSCAPLYKSHALLFRWRDTVPAACLTTFTLRHKVIDI